MKDTLVRCMDCDREERVNFATSMKSGWPFCCRETMQMIDSEADIQEELRKIYRYSSKNFTIKK